MNEIPIRNIYYMVLYALSKVKDLSNISEKNIEELEDFKDVIIELFLSEVSIIVNRGLYKEYINKVDQTVFIKGKVDISSTLKALEPNTVCHFDEYSENVMLNQILKEIISRIIKITDISNVHQKKARRLLISFNNVDRIILENKHFNKIGFNRINHKYEHIIDLGKLIYNNSIPTENAGEYRFMDIMEDEEQFSSIFEEFLRNFYKIHTNYLVKSRYYYFDWAPVEKSNLNLLPRMETDIELVYSNKKIIIDAKYYKYAFSNRSEAPKFLSNNIYQMKTYLMQNLNNYETLRGIIIYPSNGYEFNEKFDSDRGYTMEFMTVDLNMEWEDIKARLLRVL